MFKAWYRNILLCIGREICLQYFFVIKQKLFSMSWRVIFSLGGLFIGYRLPKLFFWTDLTNSNIFSVIFPAVNTILTINM